MKKTFFKTIFGRLIAITFSTFILSTILTGMLVISFFGSYAQEQKLSSLKKIAPQIADLTYTMYVENASYLSQYEYRSAYDAIFRRNLESISSVSEADIIITQRSGDIFFATPKVNLNGKQIIPKSEIENALNGEITQSIGTLDSLFDEKRLILSYPITHENEVYGVVLLSTTMPNIDRDKIMIARLFIIISTIVLLIALIFIYLVSQRMSKPLKNLNHAAKEIATGNFDSRVEVSGTDEIRDLSKTFNYMAASLKQIDDTQKNFIANVSHELRTPMTTISGFIEKILDGTIDSPEKQKEYLTIAYNETKRLSRLVSDMLDVSKMTLGQYTINKSSFDIAELIRLSVIKFGDSMDEKFLDVNIDFASDKIMVYADKDAISRVITNILDNAIKFSDLNSVIDIQVRTNANKAYIAIANDGPGIDPEDINHVFERFYKTDKSRNNIKGTGLGLHMVQNILALHDETIAVKSIDLKGNEYEYTENHPARRTTFVFSLKLS